MLLSFQGFDDLPDVMDDLPSGGKIRLLAPTPGALGGGKIRYLRDDRTRLNYGKYVFCGNAPALGEDGAQGCYVSTSFNGLGAVAFNVSPTGNLIVGMSWRHQLGDTGACAIGCVLDADGFQLCGAYMTPTGYIKAVGDFNPAALGGDNAPVLAISNIKPMGANTFYYIEMEMGTDLFKVWVDGDLVINYSGTLAFANAADFLPNCIGADVIHGSGQIFTGGGVSYDDLYLADTGGGGEVTARLGDSRIENFHITSEESNSGYTRTGGTGITDALNTFDGDTSYYAADDLDSALLGDSTDSLINTPVAIHGICVNHISRKSLSGELALVPILKSGSTTYEGTPFTLAMGYQFDNTIWELNPDGDVAWTKMTVESADFGISIPTP